MFNLSSKKTCGTKVSTSNEKNDEKNEENIEKSSNDERHSQTIDSSPLSLLQIKQSYSIICNKSAILVTTILNFLRFYLSKYIEFNKYSLGTNTLMDIVISSLLELLGDICWISPEIIKSELMEV